MKGGKLAYVREGILSELAFDADEHAAHTVEWLQALHRNEDPPPPPARRQGDTGDGDGDGDADAGDADGDAESWRL